MSKKLEQSRPRCPFFGFNWPEKGSNLIDTGGNECGLDLENHGPCQMQIQHKEVNFCRCDLAIRVRNLLDAGKHYIHFYPHELPAGIEFEPWKDLTTRT